MVAISRRVSTATRSLRYIPGRLRVTQEHSYQPNPTPEFVAFLELKHQRKLLESQLVCALDACDNLDQAKQIHAHVLRKGLNQSCYVLTKLIRTLTKLDVPIDAYPRRLFEQVRYPNPFLWTALIRGYAAQGSLEEAVSLYGRMRADGTGPVSFTFSALFKACGSVLDVDLGRQIHGQTIVLGRFDIDLYVGNTMIDMYVRCGLLDCARKVFDEMSERDVVSWTELIVAYAKRGDMDSSRSLFDGLPVKDMVAWTAMVTGFAQNAKPREALSFFERMQKLGVQTDEVTLGSVISACAQLGASRYANWVREIAGKSGHSLTHSVVIGSALVDMYSKCGNVDEAYKVFHAMKERNVFSYSSMILGFATHGRAQAAIELFHEMVKMGVKPNEVTFIGVLTACSHAGMVEQGRQLFASMRKSFGVEPSLDHYTCMVDLLGRAGKLNDALELAQTMPFEPRGGVWGALLGACRIHKNLDIAEVAAKHLFELEPEGIGNYVLLSNIYAMAGKWDGVSTVRRLIREKGLKKNPAFSWVEDQNGITHEFCAGDTSHPRCREINDTLENLLERLKAVGYEPDLSWVPYDVSDQDKRRILVSHSEKLALAFGLLSSAGGSAIRIDKNLRICGDCHVFMCGVSRVTRKEIVVRDNMRFHHFRDGNCSCGDFW